MIVIDASALIDYLIPASAFELIRDRIQLSGGELHAPYVVDIEVAHALRRLALGNRISAVQADEALADLVAARVSRYPHAPLLPRIWELRHNMTAYDAAYVALAEALDAPLITTDAHLARAPGHRATIELIS